MNAPCITIEAGAAALLDALHRAGWSAYAVGGCVRDSLLGLQPHDWDLCTAARPEQVMELFGKEQCIPTGLQHGTVTVKREGKLYEITTFRTEGSYSDGRHPDSVAFVPDVREDLARRDFTINAMAYSAEEGLLDPFGGQEDLRRGIVRAVGEPLRRFEEDALRILRLYRFAARFGFAIDTATQTAAEQLAPHLDCVSVERIEEELCKLLTAPKPGNYLEPAVLEVILPELSGQAMEEAKAVVDACPAGEQNLPVRLAALLRSLGEDGTRKALKRLRCSNARIEETAVLVRECQRRELSPQTRNGPFHCPPYCLRQQDPTRRTVFGETPAAPTSALTAKRLLSRYDLPTVERLTALCTALYPEQAEEYAALRAEAETLTARGVCCRVSQLAVNGRDLMAAGIAPGPGLKQALNALLEEVITGRLPNEKAALLAFAEEFSAS